MFPFSLRRVFPQRSSIRWMSVMLPFLLIAVARPAAGQAPDADLVTVQLRSVTPHVDAYAQVQPISVLPVNAAEAGVVAGLRVLPGMHVRAGQELAHLNGPSINALLLQSEADLRSAQKQLTTSQNSLAVQRELLPSHLTTRDALHQAEASLAQAQTAFDNAQARLIAARQMQIVSAPTDAIVLALNTADGTLVNPGQPIVTLQPSRSLWITAAFYGVDRAAIHLGMTGSFSPADGTEAVPVRVCAVFAAITAGGGESIAMLPQRPGTHWLGGEAGTVTLDAPQRNLPVIPTRALILNQGKWWVMVHTAHGDHPQAVVPGSVQGWDTAIEHGLAAGTKVVVNNAYLLFHSTIAEHYQIPD
ncbi:MAG: efflux RND transporter periplasmic adaptor subunit [Acidobacteriaceae bacterium]